MKKLNLLMLLCLFVFVANAQGKKKEKKKKKNETTVVSEAVVLPTFMDSLSYPYGMRIGMDFQKNNIEGMNGPFIGKGIESVLDTSKTKVMTQQEAMKIIQLYSQRLQEEQEQAFQQKYAQNKQDGIAFLEANQQKQGVITLPNGLQYEILTEGNGAKPMLKDQVKVHYHGTLIDGKVFDSSVERGQPATFPLQRVIVGWTEILQLMPVGSKWKVYIPQELAYGSQNQGQIAPFSTLIFEIELLEIVAK